VPTRQLKALMIMQKDLFIETNLKKKELTNGRDELYKRGGATNPQVSKGGVIGISSPA
jgi:hypothetical protein